MGGHAFDGEPAHLEIYRKLGLSPKTPLMGLSQGWNVPVVEWQLQLTDATFPGVDHYVVTLQFNEAPTARTDGPGFRRRAGRGSLSMQAPGSGATIQSSSLVHYAHLYFKPSLLEEVLQSAGETRISTLPDFFALPECVLTRDVETYVVRALTEDHSPSRLEMDSRAYLIVFELVRLTLDRLGMTSDGHVAAPSQLAPSLTMIEDGLSLALKPEDLAKESGLSLYAFNRRFREELGETPTAYIGRRRLDRAVRLIETTRIPLAEIAIKSGYSNQSHMTRKVKESLGLTPGQLRDRTRS